MQLDLGPAFQESRETVGGWIEGFVQHLPNVVAALLVLLVFWIVALLARAVVQKVMDRATDHGPVRSLVATLTYLAVLLAGLFVALGVLDLDKTVTSLLAGAGIIGLALAFAFQDTAENFSTILRTAQGQMVRIPNNDVYGEPLINYTAMGARRIDGSCGVAYGDDLRTAMQVAVEAVGGVEGRSPGREVRLFYEEFGGSSVRRPPRRPRLLLPARVASRTERAEISGRATCT